MYSSSGHYRHYHLPQTTTSSDGSSGDKYERFERWLRDNGAKFELLELREYDDCPPSSNNTKIDEEKKEPTMETDEEEENEMRGVYARCHIPPNTVCMSVPRQCLITVEMGQATPIGQAILHSDLDLDAPKHIFLMVYLLWDRKVNGKKSFFWPYYEVLPKTLHNMPIFWDESELAYLEGSYLIHQIHDRNQAIAEDYHAICQIAPLAKICTLEEFKWARMCVCSRNFGLQIDGHRTSALVPHADMLNHFRPRETKWTFDEERNAFTITSLQHIPAGAQVYDSYGQKCNHRFLLNYGFAVEDNRELDGFCPNEVPIELYVDPEDELFSEKLDYWTRGEATGFFYPQETAAASPVVKRIRVCVSNNENTRLLFSLLRALSCDREELSSLTATTSSEARALFGLPEVVRQTNSNVPFQVLQTTAQYASGHASYQRSCRDIRHPLSLRNERAAMRLLLELVNRHLSRYPTTLAQDVTDLLDEVAYPRFSNKRHAKIQVRGEKEVLHHFAQWARTALDVLDVIEEELSEERGSVEVRLTNGRTTVATESQQRPSFEYAIRRMEDGLDSEIHHTIFRYCADVLGSLRREEFKQVRRQGGETSNQRSSTGYI